jgi:hypothetical protein
MKMVRFIFFILLIGSATAFAQENWQSALSQMPLHTNATALNRTNCVPLLLNAFQPSDKVKALIFMPGATDEI